MRILKNVAASAALVGLVMVLVGCATTTAPAPVAPAQQPAANSAASNQARVSIANFAFQPASVPVAVGGTVTWTNNDSASHTITADDSSFDSGSIVPGSTFSHTFATAGSVAYHCSFHGSMHGTVVVGN